MALTHEPRSRSKSRSRNREYRGRIADAVRLEVAKQGLEIAVERAQRNDDVHLYLRHQIVDGQSLVGNRVEALLEFLQSRALDREAGGATVPAEADEQIATRQESSVQVERRDGASRAFSFVAIQRDHHHGTARLLDDA